MFAWFRSAKRALLNEDAIVAVPAMDGPFKPNNALEQADRLFMLPEVDSLAAAGAAIYCVAGTALYRIEVSQPVMVQTFSARALFCAGARDGRLIVGVEGEGLALSDEAGVWRSIALPKPLSDGMTAGAFLDPQHAVVCIGSTRHAARDWKRDLMETGAAGVLVIVDLTAGSVTRIAESLAFPYGVLVEPDGRCLVSESWAHRLVRYRPAPGATPELALDELPAYPARLAAAADGGFWLALFAPRRQLFELLLGEDDFRKQMIASVDPDEWIGPDLRASSDPWQPLQQGSVRQMGIVKPWAPSRSYGLVLRCDRDGAPIRAWHSRADGALHGVTAIVENAGDLLFVSRGANLVGRLRNVGLEHD